MDGGVRNEGSGISTIKCCHESVQRAVCIHMHGPDGVCVSGSVHRDAEGGPSLKLPTKPGAAKADSWASAIALP